MPVFPHAVSDDNHFVEFRVTHFGVTFTAYLFQGFAQPCGGECDWFTGGIQIEPELIAASDFGVSLQVIEHFHPRHWG